MGHLEQDGTNCKAWASKLGVAVILDHTHAPGTCISWPHNDINDAVNWVSQHSAQMNST